DSPRSYVRDSRRRTSNMRRVARNVIRVSRAATPRGTTKVATADRAVSDTTALPATTSATWKTTITPGRLPRESVGYPQVTLSLLWNLSSADPWGSPTEGDESVKKKLTAV